MGKQTAALMQLEIRGPREPYEYSNPSSDLFGSIAGPRYMIPAKADFIPIDNKSNVISLGGDNVPAVWLGLANKHMQFWAYNYCNPLAAIIDRLAEADSNGRLYILNAKDDSTNENWKKNPKLNRVMTLMKNPNPWQTRAEFNAEQVIYCKIFGYCPVFAIGPKGMDKSYTRALVNFNPFFAEPVYNDEFSLFEGKPLIKQWKITIANKEYNVDASDIILVKDGFIGTNSTRSALPMSKIAGLDYFISNICAAMEADNVLLKKKGPLGVFSYDAKPDIAGQTPMKPGQKDELEMDLGRYGLSLGQLQYVVSKQPIKWNAMSFNLRDLMTKETVRQGIDGICDRFGYPAELMSGKNATYENRTSAEKFLYNTVITPFALRRMETYDSFFGLEDFRLYLDYDHLKIMQEDITKSSQAAKFLSESLDVDLKNNMITVNEWRKAKDMEKVDGGDVYYSEWLKNKNLQEHGTTSKNTSVKE